MIHDPGSREERIKSIGAIRSGLVPSGGGSATDRSGPSILQCTGHASIRATQEDSRVSTTIIAYFSLQQSNVHTPKLPVA